ncbi:hypothetical protein [Pimelobacter simplex]|uniref:hypothetical protein n=1 Tax=Nocardioides simplex TaxID=2045 RepID=UPI003AAAC0EA
MGSIFPTVPPDDAPGRPGETLWQFLSRSPWPRSIKARETIDTYVSRLAPDAVAEVLPRLRADDRRLVRSTITELWIHDQLHEAGARPLAFGAETASGGTIDVLVGPERTHIEVHRASESARDFADERRRQEVLHTLERLHSPHLWLEVAIRLGATAPPIRKYLAEIQRWLDSLDLDELRQEQAAGLAPFDSVTHQVGGADWCLTIRVSPRAPGSSPTPVVGAILGGTVPMESIESIGRSLRRKRRQHRAVSDPLVVALDLTDGLIWQDEIEGALYGPTVDDLTAPERRAYRRRSDGLWQPGSADPPAGVLTITELSLSAPEQAKATLWLPPGRPSPIPAAPWEVRTLDESSPLATVRA